MADVANQSSLVWGSSLAVGPRPYDSPSRGGGALCSESISPASHPGSAKMPAATARLITTGRERAISSYGIHFVAHTPLGAIEMPFRSCFKEEPSSTLTL